MQWWQSTLGKPNIQGIVLLALVLLYHPDIEIWSTEFLDRCISKELFTLHPSKWKDIYERSAEKYPDQFKPQIGSKPPSEYPKRKSDGILRVKSEKMAKCKELMY